MILRFKMCALIALLAATSNDTKATVLYVRVTPQEIVIGADSKRTAETGATVCVCKITRIDDTFIASAGLAEFGAFDPREIAVQAIRNSSTLVEARTKFEQQIEQPLIEVLTKLRVRNRERYEAFKKGAAVNMVFARFRDEPELVGSALTPKDNSDGSISLVKNQITLLDVKKSKRIFVGVSKRVEMILDRPSLWWKGTVAGVQQILEMSIQDNKEAGGPIDIVQITKDGARWFPREPACDNRSRRINEQPTSCNSSP
jgi:hypothetical protein